MTYDREHFKLAHERFLLTPKVLTDGDLEQLAVVDPTLAERARAKRAGFVEAEDDDDRKLATVPVTQKGLLTWQKDVIGPMISTFQFRLDEAHVLIRSLEARVLELEARDAARTVPHGQT